MSDLTPVLRYLKSWGQHDAYDRVLAARDRIDFQAEVIDSQARHIEQLEAQDAANVKGIASLIVRCSIAEPQGDAALATIERLREAAERVNRAWLRGDIDAPNGEGPAALLALHRATDTEERTDG